MTYKKGGVLRVELKGRAIIMALLMKTPPAVRASGPLGRSSTVREAGPGLSTTYQSGKYVKSWE